MGEDIDSLGSVVGLTSLVLTENDYGENMRFKKASVNDHL